MAEKVEQELYILRFPRQIPPEIIKMEEEARAWKVDGTVDPLYFARWHRNGKLVCEKSLRGKGLTTFLQETSHQEMEGVERAGFTEVIGNVADKVFGAVNKIAETFGFKGEELRPEKTDNLHGFLQHPDQKMQ